MRYQRLTVPHDSEQQSILHCWLVSSLCGHHCIYHFLERLRRREVEEMSTCAKARCEPVLKPLQRSGIHTVPLGWCSVEGFIAVFMADIPKTLAKILVLLLLVVSSVYLIALIACSSVLRYLQHILSHRSISQYCKLIPSSHFIKVGHLQT